MQAIRINAEYVDSFDGLVRLTKAAPGTMEGCK